jgi:hypothetical protein
MNLIIGIIAIFMVLNPAPFKLNIKEINEQKMPEYVPTSLKLYYKDLMEDAVAHKVPKKYLDRMDNIIFKIITEQDDDDFLKNFFTNTPEYRRTSVIALCASVYNIVYIREKMMKKEKPVEIQEVIDHEVGHCAFGRIHRDQIMPYEDTILPRSIMTATHVTVSNDMEYKLLESPLVVYFYDNKKLKEFYRNELFNINKFDEDLKVTEYKKTLLNLSQEQIEMKVSAFELDLGLVD